MNRRLLSAACLAYGLLVLYGCLMPYDLYAGADHARDNLRRALSFWPLGTRLHVSRTDLTSNFLLYLPFGLLLATRWRVRPKGGSAVGAVLFATVVGGLVSAAVEAGQLFSLSRVSGVQDLAMNAAGALAGGVVGALAGPRAWSGLERGIRGRWIDRPAELVALALLLALAADALFPFRPTLDVSEVWGNVKRSHLSLSAGWAAHPWHYWLVHRVGVYAALSVLLAGALGRGGGPSRLLGAALAVGFAALAEATKLFITTGYANVANVAASAGGAAAGVVLGALLAGRLSDRDRIGLAWVLLVAYIVYLEWGGLEFQWHPQDLSAKMPSGAGWLPLYHYAISARPHDLRNFVRTIVLLAALACAGRLWEQRMGFRGGWSSPWSAACLAGVMGLVLELGQFLLPERMPSVTDVFCFAVGGAVGSWLAGARQAQETPQANAPREA